MWRDLIAKGKEGGLDGIETYVFWNLHEPQQGQYDFSGGRDLVKFIKEIQAQGLYVTLRIGPYIEAEWTYGGLPIWLHDVPGIVFRSDNEPYKFHMQNFTTKIVDLMKSAKLFASQGGPIILSQIENEYGNVQRSFHKSEVSYVNWCAQMALGQKTGVPWVMCKQDDAPGEVINTCNGMQCGKTFKGPNSPNKPSLWTENWTSFYQAFGDKPYLRSAENIAYNVALFVAKKGSYVNYYMVSSPSNTLSITLHNVYIFLVVTHIMDLMQFHGGTNFDRVASAFITTAYYDEAPLDEYGLIKEPKWSHLKQLHAAIKSCSDSLLYGTQTVVNLGNQQIAYVYKKSSTGCAAFLENTDAKEVTIQFQDAPYKLPSQSISILPDCKTVAFNTAKVSVKAKHRTMKPQFKFDSAEKWKVYKEPIPNFDDTSSKENKLLDQITKAKDTSDYLWYTFRLNDNSPNAQSVLRVESQGHVLHAFVNGVLVGSAHGNHKNVSFIMEKNVNLIQGRVNNISLLSATVGLPNSGAYLERRVAGLTAVKVQGKDFTNEPWGYQVGLVGEKLQIYTASGSSKVQWESFKDSTTPLTWYQTTFDAPVGNDPVALNLGSMGKGQAWINGQGIGRYWVSFHTPKGDPSQIWYHIPRSYLKPTGNLLVLQEEETGNPLAITVDTVTYE
ncbi:putative beta-galactosidase [Lupinus albus]|uniref:Beta-galactosidase n=1 Tax=Lupinus albus TaxID=3870 RepID=A0A6A4Q4U3_LUPAL|nr:putative beta-galactosidase [Lupinus albus]